MATAFRATNYRRNASKVLLWREDVHGKRWFASSQPSVSLACTDSSETRKPKMERSGWQSSAAICIGTALALYVTTFPHNQL